MVWSPNSQVAAACPAVCLARTTSIARTSRKMIIGAGGAAPVAFSAPPPFLRPRARDQSRAKPQTSDGQSSPLVQFDTVTRSPPDPPGPPTLRRSHRWLAHCSLHEPLPKSLWIASPRIAESCRAICACASSSHTASLPSWCASSSTASKSHTLTDAWFHAMS